jgi:plastocyanin
MMKRWIVGLIVVLVVIGIFFIFSGSSDDSDSENGTSAVSSDSENGASIIGSGNEDVKTFVMTGENFKFVMDGADNPDLVVKEGDKVRIEFTSTSGFHDWVVDEFDVATQQVRDNEGMTSVEFVADKKGTFEYYCSVGQHRANGMKGTFVVE